MLSKKINKFKLTIIVPTYNRYNSLKKTLPTFLKSKRKDICFLILNNNSTDKTVNLVNKYQKKDKRIFLISHKNNIGAANNFRFGLKKVSTPYVTIVSDDDLLKGNYFSSCIEIFEKYKEVGLIHHEFGKVFKKKNRYNIYKKGLQSSKEAYRYSSMIAGLSFRTKLLNFDYYPTKKSKVYSYLSQVLPITQKNSFAKINNAGFIPLNKDTNLTFQTLKSYRKLQQRPFDYGISEICDYVINSKLNEISKLEILSKKLKWFCLISILYPKEDFAKLLYQTRDNLGKYFIIFYIYQIIFKFNKSSLKYFLLDLINPFQIFKNIYNVYLILKYSIKYIIKKCQN